MQTVQTKAAHKGTAVAGWDSHTWQNPMKLENVGISLKCFVWPASQWPVDSIMGVYWERNYRAEVEFFLSDKHARSRNRRKTKAATIPQVIWVTWWKRSWIFVCMKVSLKSKCTESSHLVCSLSALRVGKHTKEGHQYFYVPFSCSGLAWYGGLQRNW